MTAPFMVLHRLVGILLGSLGLFILTGWLTGNEVMVRVLPNSPAMAVNTAILLVVAALNLLLSGYSGKAEKLYLACAIVLIGLPAAISSQHFFDFDLGIDWPSMHAALGDGHAKPGRTAPNACLAFIAAGIVFLLNRRSRPPRKLRRWCYLLAFVPLAIGGLAVLGYMLNLEAMYTIASYNRMAMLTGLGVFTLGIGLFGLIEFRRREYVDTPNNNVRQITRLSIALLTSFAVAAGLTGFAILRQGFEETSRSNLLSAVKADAYIISTELSQAIARAKSLGRRSSLRSQLASLSGVGSPAATRQDLQNLGDGLLEFGFSAIVIADADGAVLVEAGKVAPTTAIIEVPVAIEADVRLLWQDGYVLSSTQKITHDGALVGWLTAESRLDELAAFMRETQVLRRTNEVLLCGQASGAVSCFINDLPQQLLRYPATLEGRYPQPANRAVLGQMGTAPVKDDRGFALQAGFAPLPNFPGLGLVVHQSVSELYLPLRERLNLLTAVLTAFVILGTLLIRQWVLPLLEKIAAEQSRIKSILDNSGDAFIAVGPNGRVSDWNRQAESLLGISAAAIVGKSLDEWVAVEQSAEQNNGGLLQLMTVSTGPISSRRAEIDVLHANGNKIPVELSVAAYRAGDSYGVGAFLRDLSERRQAEWQSAKYSKELQSAREALLRSQKLEAVGKLTGGVAHDFNNVLQVVKGSLQLLQLENAQRPAVVSRVGVAMAAVDRGAKLASQLLTFARKQPLQPQTINPVQMIQGMGEMLQRALGDAIEIDWQIDGASWNTSADVSQLENVMLNLAINARDAMQGRGRLTITVGNVALDANDVGADPDVTPGPYVMLALSDTGSGMSGEVLERVFEPFFTTKAEGEGTGLGLSMAHGFVKQTGGHIDIESELGRGTTIRIYLPKCDTAATPRVQAPIVEIRGGHETILVVEDNDSVRSTAVEVLTGLGYRVLQADSAAAALTVLNRGLSIDLLFTDVVMPGSLRAPELAKRAVEIFPQIKVLFTSGYTQDAINHSGRLDPGVHLLSKPYGRDQLAHKLRELFDADSADTNAALRRPGSTTGNGPNQIAKILLVEDDASFREVVIEMMQLLGHQVTSVATAEAALDYCSNQQIDILITDVSLPGLSGIELADRIVRAAPSVKIVLASGYGGELSSRDNFKYQILSKPFSIEQLTAQIQLALRDDSVAAEA